MKEVTLITGETFSVDNEMKRENSCTEWDVLKFKNNGLIRSIDGTKIKLNGRAVVYVEDESKMHIEYDGEYFHITQEFAGFADGRGKETISVTKAEIKKILELIEEMEEEQ